MKILSEIQVTVSSGILQLLHSNTSMLPGLQLQRSPKSSTSSRLGMVFTARQTLVMFDMMNVYSLRFKLPSFDFMHKEIRPAQIALRDEACLGPEVNQCSEIDEFPSCVPSLDPCGSQQND